MMNEVRIDIHKFMQEYHEKEAADGLFDLHGNYLGPEIVYIAGNDPITLLKSQKFSGEVCGLGVVIERSSSLAFPEDARKLAVKAMKNGCKLFVVPFFTFVVSRDHHPWLSAEHADSDLWVVAKSYDELKSKISGLTDYYDP